MAHFLRRLSKEELSHDKAIYVGTGSDRCGAFVGSVLLGHYPFVVYVRADSSGGHNGPVL